MKAKLMVCLVVLSVTLAGYVSCLIASQIHWDFLWITAPSVLPGLSFGFVIAGWLLHRRWITRKKGVGLVVGCTVAYFVAYWSAFYIVALCGAGMVLYTSRLAMFHAGIIAGLLGIVLLITNLAIVSPDFRRKNWKTLILIGTAAGGALCLTGMGATSDNDAGRLGDPGGRAFIFVWQLLVGGYIGLLLFAIPSASKSTQRSRSAQWAVRTVYVLLAVSIVQAAIGYSRGKMERSVASSSASSQSSASPPVAQQAIAASAVALMLGAAAPEAKSTGASDGPPQLIGSDPRSEDSLAAERYLRTRLIGGLTENQIIELSDSIAAKFDAADLPAKEREWCFSGSGDKRKLQLCTLYDLRSSSSLASPEAKRAAKQLMEEIMHTIPPRAVFSGLFSNSSSERPVKSFPVETPLPPADVPIGHGYRSPGALVRERLQPLETVIRIMSEDNPSDADRAFEMVKSLGTNQENDSSLEMYRERGPAVLVCGYQGGFKDTSWKRLFWYKKEPDGLSELLKSLPADHPIREIGPARDSAPATLELALQANPHSADKLLKEISEEKERAERPPPGPELTNAEKFWAALGVLAAGAIAADTIVTNRLEKEAQEQRERVAKIVAASNGTKIECPKCHGMGQITDFAGTNRYSNPYPYSTMPGSPYQNFEEARYNNVTRKCDRCDGNGWVDK